MNRRFRPRDLVGVVSATPGLLVVFTTVCVSHLSCAPVRTGDVRPDTQSAAPQGPATAPAGPPAPFTETVPHSTVKFVLRPLPIGRVTTADRTGPGGSRATDVRPVWIGETEVTWDAYDVFLLRLDVPEGKRASAEADPGPDAVTRPTPPYAPPDRGWGHAGYPALGVTFHAARQYCRWLSEKTGRRYRLPTVAEWGYACWGGVQGPSGEPPGDDLTGRAWFFENADERAHPVGKKRPNALGLYDTLGNVAEWCTDADGRPVVCGGSFRTEGADLSCGLREPQGRDWTAGDPSFPPSKWWLSDGAFVGFRVVCEDVTGDEP